MPIDYKKYPPNWKTEIRPRILKRANNSCEFCGIRNYDMRWNGKKYIKIILTIAHLDRDSYNWDAEDNRLAALCQLCHLNYDRKYKIKQKKMTTAKELLKKVTGKPSHFRRQCDVIHVDMAIEYAKLKCKEQREICREKPPTARKCYPIGIIMKNLKPKTFEEAVRPLMQWMAENCHPHTKSIVESNAAELFEGLKVVVTDEYLTD